MRNAVMITAFLVRLAFLKLRIIDLNPIKELYPILYFSKEKFRNFDRIDEMAGIRLLNCVQMVRLKFADPAQEADGFLALFKRLSVICFPDQTYEIAKSGLSVLKELGIRYQVIAEEEFDHAYQT